MNANPPNPVTGLPYTLVEVADRPERLGGRILPADSTEWKLWLVKYAWLLSLITAAPGIALVAFTVTRELAFSLSITAVAVLAPGVVFWRRTRRLP